MDAVTHLLIQLCHTHPPALIEHKRPPRAPKTLFWLRKGNKETLHKIIQSQA
jgi:hypothetical protein